MLLSIYGNDPSNTNYDIVRDQYLNPYNVPNVGAYGTRITTRYNGPGSYKIFYYKSSLAGNISNLYDITFSSTAPQIQGFTLMNQGFTNMKYGEYSYSRI